MARGLVGAALLIPSALLGLAGAATAQTFPGPAAVGVNTSGSAGSINAGPISFTVSGNIPINNCTAGQASCVSAVANGWNPPSSGVPGMPGNITISISPGALLGQNDANAAYGNFYQSGISATTIGGTASTTPYAPLSGGNVVISNAGGITVNTSSNPANNPADLWYAQQVTIQHQAGMTDEVFYFGGGILGFSKAGNGPAYGTDGKGFQGSGAANGANVTITNTGSIQTGAMLTTHLMPAINPGILALNVGGDAAGLFTGKTNSWFLVGAGGAAGSISVTNQGRIATAAPLSPGVLALSQGGAGSVAAGSVAGGAGGTVIVTSGNVGANAPATSIATTGDQSHGIFAVSAGGNVAGSEEQGISGPAGAVTVSNQAMDTISTSGDFAAGVVAASVAGGLADTQAQVKSFTTGGGTGGVVNVTINGNVQADGNGSDGVVAQSIGAGGGVTQVQGGGSSSQYTLGATTTSASSASSVTVVNNGSIKAATANPSTGRNVATDGASDAPQDSIGIVAQSIAGGGGIAYLASSSLQATVGSTTPGQTGNGNAGGPVSVTNNGGIATGQDGGDGILAQSIGGGGGNGKGQGWIVRYGTSGGGGGGGGTLAVTNNGAIQTAGWQADGILAQSIGGGGGAGGNASGGVAAVGGAAGAGGAGGSVSVNSSGNISIGGDDAYGILAESVGGGGGNGGKGSAWMPVLAVSVGGSGGSGGNGGQVTINQSGGMIATGNEASNTGSQSYGLVAHSIGGGGGAGGASKANSGGLWTFSVAVGGGGATGGTGGAVAVTAESVRTSGNDAHAVVAQSVGGGGGIGGESLARALAAGGGFYEDIPSIAATFAIGGSGGAGGDGGQVGATLNGGMSTSASGAYGLYAQSIGGGGGIGGDSTATAATVLSKPLSKTASISSSVGGSGGVAGAGGQVTATVMPGASVTTKGDHAHGIMAQSVGGGGGAGGVGDANARVPTVSLGVNVEVAVGGSSGAGGNSGAVSLFNEGSIATYGSSANGLFAQAIGGGGGSADGGTAGMSSAQAAQNAAKYSASFSVGGNGGGGGNGGALVVSSTGQIATRGGSAMGILAQSVGGGGGTAGNSDANAGLSESDLAAGANAFGKVYGEGTEFYNLVQKGAEEGEVTFKEFGGETMEAFTDYGLNVAVGGHGGKAGTGGAVSVTVATDGASNTATVTTVGDLAHGVVAQSIGGGGGSGGAATSNILKGDWQSFTASVGLSVGGAAGAAGDGGAISVRNGDYYAGWQNTITTRGDQAMGIIAQSVGGGGGIGGASGVVTGGSISLGGGGGGTGGSAGGGGAVYVANYAGIQTQGDDAVGIFAQSIGGGGGFGGSATATKAEGKTELIPINVVVGGKGGSSGVGGNVNINQTNGTIATAGDRAFGILAQSVGGGGGFGGTGSAETWSAIHVMGGDATSNGNGGAVAVLITPTRPTPTPAIQTSGDGAHAIVAQSVGGGGGITGDTSLAPTSYLPSNIGQSTTNQGSGGAVTVLLNGNAATPVQVLTSGVNAHGIVAQSVGGGGGIVDGALGTSGGVGYGGAVSVTVGGTVIASGSGSYGIFAQSVGQGRGGSPNNGTINIQIPNGGSVTGAGAGVFVSAGNYGNTLAIASGGTLCGAQCNPSAVAVVADPLTLTPLNINNAGILTGTLALGNNGQLVNTGTFTTSGASATAWVTNGPGGVIDLGGTATAQARFWGELTLQAGSQILVDADFYHRVFDSLYVNGSLYLEGGTLAVRPTLLVPQTLSGVVFAATAGSSGPIDAPSSDLIYSYAVSTAAANGGGINYNLTANANYTPSAVALNGNQTSTARGLQGLWNGWQPQAPDALQLAQVFTNLYGQDPASYPDQLTALSSEAAGSSAAGSAGTATSFIGTTQSCPGFVGDGTLLAEGECGWARVTGSARDRSASGEHGGYRGESVAIQGGGQKRLADGWFLGGAIGLEEIWQQSNNGRERSDGNAVMAGVAIKRQQGPWLLSAALGFGYGWDDSTRQVVLPGWFALASSSPKTDFQIGRLRASYEIPMQRWYLRPILDLDVIRVHQAGYRESGAGALNLVISDRSQTLFAVTPALEIGGRIDLTNTLTARPYLTLGVTRLSEDTWETKARFQGQGGANSPAMTVNTPIPDTLARVVLGVDLLRKDGSEKGWEAKLQYEGEFADNYTANGGTLRVGYRF